jgi:FAD/FMN-containing dehydrogenase
VHVYNMAIPVIPAAVVRPNTPEDVAAAVKCAVDNAVKVQARGGGHSYANFCAYSNFDVLKVYVL